MQPLEKAKLNKDRVNYCDECEQFEIVGNAAYCKVDGKLILPMMLVRGQGTGAAWNCKKRRKPQTNYDRIVSKTPEELATWIDDYAAYAWCPVDAPIDQETHECLVHDGDCRLCILDWLRKEATE